MFLLKTPSGPLDGTGRSMKIVFLLGNFAISGLHKMSYSKLIVAFVAMVLSVSAFSPVVAAKYTKQFQKVSELLLGDGIVLVQQKQFEQAIQVLEQAVVADPKNAPAFSYLGFSHQQTGNLPDATKYFGIALTIDPNEVRALNWGGQADLSNKDLDAAKEKLSRLSRVCGPSCIEYKELTTAVNAFKNKATN